MLVVVLAASVAASPAAAGRKAPSLFPSFRAAVPILLYHGVATEGFEAQMGRLHDLGFEAITLEQYVRFMRGGSVDLPQRPILITFDDARASALRNADPVLARYGWGAAMYVPTGFVGRGGYLTWGELRQMRSSGRWFIDEHAGDGHVTIPADEAGRRLPSYAAELWANGEQETFAHYTQRVSGDIELGAALLAQNLSGWRSYGTFAVPFGNYGQRGSNDDRIGPWLARYLQSRFSSVFVQRDDSFATPGQTFANRIGVSSALDPDALEARLLRGLDDSSLSARARQTKARSTSARYGRT